MFVCDKTVWRMCLGGKKERDRKGNPQGVECVYKGLHFKMPTHAHKYRNVSKITNNKNKCKKEAMDPSKLGPFSICLTHSKETLPRSFVGFGRPFEAMQGLIK